LIFGWLLATAKLFDDFKFDSLPSSSVIIEKSALPGKHD